MKKMPLAACLCVGLLSCHNLAMEKSLVIACNFDVVSQNPEASTIVCNAMANATSILAGVPLRTLARLINNANFLKERSLELSATTIGTTNVIKKLFAELQNQDYGVFSPQMIYQICKAGIQPSPDKEAFNHIKRIAQFGIPIILFGKKDSLEFEIFEHKMQDNYSIFLTDFFHGIVTCPTIEEQALKFEKDDCLKRSPFWFVAHQQEHTVAFNKAVRALANDIKAQSNIITINDKASLKKLVDGLQQVCTNHVRSPELEHMLATCQAPL